MAGTLSLSRTGEAISRLGWQMKCQQSCRRQYDFDSHRATVPDQWDEPTQRSLIRHSCHKELKSWHHTLWLWVSFSCLSVKMKHVTGDNCPCFQMTCDQHYMKIESEPNMTRTKYTYITVDLNQSLVLDSPVSTVLYFYCQSISWHHFGLQKIVGAACNHC